MSHNWSFAEAKAAYVRANAGTLEWMLGRPLLHGVYLNTKQNSVTLRDYTADDAWRAPDVIYGWIQGRGLEALVQHARFFEAHSPTLAEPLFETARILYAALADLYQRDRKAYFAYDSDGAPIYPGPDGQFMPQLRADDLYTYSDVFVIKGLIAASAAFDASRTPTYLDALHRVVEAVEHGRFVTNERQALAPEAVSRDRDYGPRMILLGAASLLCELGFSEAAGFGGRFIDHILRHHVEDGHSAVPSGVVRDTPQGDHCNPGHAIEFAGFALEYLPEDADPALVGLLEGVLLRSFELGFSKPGISLRVSLGGHEPPSAYCPWWSLPETVRAAARAYARTGNPLTLNVWRTAHEAFFNHYWRGTPALAYQTLTSDGPVDYVPATPDLDPGYHTGLSFLSAIHAIDAISPKD